jgi:rubrerythrin
MTSVFEVLSNKETLVGDDLVKVTDQKHQSAIQTKKENELTSRKYFMICQTCFWCASYIDIMGHMDALPYKVCPICNHTAIELLPLSDGEHYRFEYTAIGGVILKFR